MRGERFLIRVVYKKGTIKRYTMLARIWMKSIVYMVFAIFRLQDILIKNRANKMNDSSLQKASEDLLAAVHVKVV